MLSTKIVFNISTIIFSTIIFVCSIAIVIAIQFQKKQKKKYEECVKIIKEKENDTLNYQNGVDENYINEIDENINVDQFMMELYGKYLELIDKLNNNSKEFENILTGFIKEFYDNKIDIQNNKRIFDIIEGIELINYTILEFNRFELKFRINITCFNYKKAEEEIISGSNLTRVNQIIVLSYCKIQNEWLINDIEKVYEQKLSI